MEYKKISATIDKYELELTIDHIMVIFLREIKTGKCYTYYVNRDDY